MLYRSLRQEVLDVVTPSALSVGVATVSSFFVVLSSIWVAFYRGSTFDYYNTVLSQEPTSLQGKLEVAKIAVNSNNTIADASVFITWMVVGIATYACISAVLHFVTWSMGMSYTMKITRGTQRSHVLAEILIRFVLRLIGAVAVFALLKVFLFVAPALTVSLKYLSETRQLHELLVIIVGAIFLTVVAVLWFTVAARLVTLRRRVLF
jgi:hypothetical protein